MATLRFRVSEREAGQRLDRVLATRSEVGSRAAATRLVEAGAVLVDGHVRPKRHLVTAGTEIEVDLVPEHVEAVTPPAIAIVLEDDHLLVVDKPPGMVVHAGSAREQATLADAVLPLGARGGEEGRLGIVHRLDRDTSGLTIVARSPRAHTRLAAMIRRREVERRYLALVCGRPRSLRGRIEAPTGRDRHDRTRMSIDTDTPRDAVTWFEVRELLGKRALLEAQLETGRTHQIRVHLAAVELPVSGDPVYGVAGDLGLRRQFLHAHRLRFEHPVSGEKLDVSSALPPDLEDALARARSELPSGAVG